MITAGIWYNAGLNLALFDVKPSNMIRSGGHIIPMAVIHLTTGTHVAQICWFLLNEANFIPARLLQTSPSREGGRDAKACGRYEIIDIDLSKYDRLSTRFAQEQERTLDFLKSGIATKSKGFNKLIEQIELVAVNSKAPILIMGPTGAGKSMLAGRIERPIR
jgi:transcriptional regulatory protein RtcR